MRIKHSSGMITFFVLQGCFFLQVYLPAMLPMQTEIHDVASGKTESLKNIFYNGKL